MREEGHNHRNMLSLLHQTIMLQAWCSRMKSQTAFLLPPKVSACRMPAVRLACRLVSTCQPLKHPQLISSLLLLPSRTSMYRCLLRPLYASSHGTRDAMQPLTPMMKLDGSSIMWTFISAAPSLQYVCAGSVIESSRHLRKAEPVLKPATASECTISPNISARA